MTTILRTFFLAIFAFVLTLTAAIGLARAAQDVPGSWQAEFPKADFSRSSVDVNEIMSGGPPRDGIPPLDAPAFKPVAEITDVAGREPVITLVVDGVAKAYPLRVLTWHEIANDTIGTTPVAVTFCPLCNAAIVFDRRLADRRVLDFGTTGKLRRSDLVMYDRQTESWWQQFSGEAIIGELTGTELVMLPSRLDSYERFVAKHPDGLVLVPNNARMRDYGRNPYVGYDTAARPFLYRGDMPEGISPMARVVVVGDEAWPLQSIREKGTIIADDLRLSWTKGQASALDSGRIRNGRDVGNVTVTRTSGAGESDAVHHVTFAFVFHAFKPDGTLHLN